MIIKIIAFKIFSFKVIKLNITGYFVEGKEIYQISPGYNN